MSISKKKYIPDQLISDQMLLKIMKRYSMGISISTLSEKLKQRIPRRSLQRRLSLHEGNIARYQIHPAEFAAWNIQWQKRL